MIQTSHYISQLKTAGRLALTLIIVTGIVYPLTITLIAQLLFHTKANGSLIYRDETAIGSMLIGQNFTDDKYFYGRPSATVPFPYNAEASSGSNFGPTNPAYYEFLTGRIAELKQGNQPIPIDFITSSGSGLDPEISPNSAYYQVARIAKARHIPESELNDLIKQFTISASLILPCEARVNVLALNLALEEQSKHVR